MGEQLSYSLFKTRSSDLINQFCFKIGFLAFSIKIGFRKFIQKYFVVFNPFILLKCPLKNILLFSILLFY